MFKFHGVDFLIRKMYFQYETNHSVYVCDFFIILALPLSLSFEFQIRCHLSFGLLNFIHFI